MNADALADWVAERVGAETLMLLSAAVLLAVQAARVVAARIVKARPYLTWLAEFTDWWLVGAAIGAVLGLVWVEASLEGALAGLLAAVLATGGFEYLTRGGAALAAPGAARPQG